MIGVKAIQQLGKALEENLKKELRDQGHYLTGELERSIKSVLTGETVLETTAVQYQEDLEEGIPASHIPTDAAYIQLMADYATKRFGYTGKKALQVGVLIAKRHRKEGNPTKNSYQFSTTGERTHAAEDSLYRHEKENEQILENAISFEVDDFINETFTETVF